MDKFTFYTTIENQICPVSEIPYYSAMLIHDDGTVKQEIFDRRELTTFE